MDHTVFCAAVPQCRSSTEILSYDHYEVGPSREADTGHVWARSVCPLESLIFTAGDFGETTVRETEFCHWWWTSTECQTGGPNSFKKGKVAIKFWEESQHYKHRKTWMSLNRPTITELAFHFSHTWGSRAALVLKPYELLKGGWVLIKPTSSVVSWMLYL